MPKQPATWFFQMPWHVTPPMLTDELRGLDKVVLLDQKPSDVSATVLDSSDERLLHAGVKLVHRGVGEHGDWFLWSRLWRPWLPKKPNDSLGTDAEMPDEFAELLRPFRRNATIGPVLSITRNRGRYGLVTTAGEIVATLTDDRITVRRSGIATGRYREVSVSTGTLKSSQREFVAASLLAIGGTKVDAFPSIFDRIENLAPRPMKLTDEPPLASTESYLRWLMARYFHNLVVADLSLRVGSVTDTTPLANALDEVRDGIGAVAGIMDTQWCQEQLGKIDALEHSQGTSQLNNMDYLGLLDALDMAIRVPPANDDAPTPARKVFSAKLNDQLRQTIAVIDRAVELQSGKQKSDNQQGSGTGDIQISHDQLWAQALNQASDALRLTAAAKSAVHKPGRTEKLLTKIVAGLSAAQPQQQSADADQIAMMSPNEVWQLGYQAGVSSRPLGKARDAVVRKWPGWRDELVALHRLEENA